MKSRSRAGPFGLLGLLLATSRTKFFAAIIAGAIAGVSGAFILALINIGLRPDGQTPRNALLFAAVCVVLVLSRNASQTLLSHIGQDAIFGLRRMLAARIVDTPVRRLEEMGSHRVMAVLTEDLGAIAAACAAVPLICIDAALSIGCFAYQLWLAPVMFLITAGMLLLLSVFFWAFPVRWTRAAFQRARVSTDALYKDYRGLTDGIKELKLSRARRAHFLDHSLKGSAWSVRQCNVTAVKHSNLMYSLQQIMYLGIIGALLFAVSSPLDVSIGTLTGFVLSLHYLELSWGEVIGAFPIFQRAQIALDRLEAPELATPEITTPASPAPLWNKLEFKSVAVSYRVDGKSGFMMGPIDLTLTPGQLVFLVGSNGSGKTTFAKVLTGLYPPDSGDVHLDGMRLEPSTLGSFRELFSAIFVDSYLFDLMVGDEHLDERAREYMAKLQLQLDHKVSIRAGQFSTVALSHGQRRRLALLMAWLEDRPIYVLDEWAADQDPEFRRFFYLELLPSLRDRGKLVVVISHDDRYFHIADRILKFDEGKLSELSARTVRHTDPNPQP